MANGQAQRKLRWAVAGFVLMTAGIGSFAAFAASGKNQYVPPRLYDGKTPDLRGIWAVRDTAYMDIEGHPAENGVAAQRSIIVDPSDGKIPYKPEAIKQRDENFKNRTKADPSIQCDAAGIPRAGYLATPLQIVQSPGNTAIVYQENHVYRIIYPDSKPHFDGIGWWMGDSRGHWEGDTLVIDVVSLNEFTWFDQAGNYHGDDMHVVERYTRTGPNTLAYEARIEDPQTLTRPFTIRETLYRDTRPDARLIEDECLIDVSGKRTHMSPFDPKSVHPHYDLQQLMNEDRKAAAN